MTEQERLKQILAAAESGRRDAPTDESIEAAESRGSARDRELHAYKDYYDDVKQHGGVKENAFRSEDW